MFQFYLFYDFIKNAVSVGANFSVQPLVLQAEMSQFYITEKNHGERI